MASYLTAYDKQNYVYNPIQRDYEGIFKTMQVKDAYWKMGVSIAKTSYEKAAGLSLTGENNKKTLEVFMKEVQPNLQKLLASDVSILENAYQAVEIYKPLYDLNNPVSKELMEDHNITEFYKGQMEKINSSKLKENGKYYFPSSASLVQDTYNDFREHLKNGGSSSDFKDLVEYTDFVDPSVKMKEAVDKCGETEFYSPIMTVNDKKYGKVRDVRYIDETTTNLKSATMIQNCIDSALNDQERNTLYIEGISSYKNNKPKLLQEYRANLDNEISSYNLKLDQLILAKAGTKDKNILTDIEKMSLDLTTRIKKLNDEKVGDDKTLLSDWKNKAARMYTTNKIHQYSVSREKSKINPRIAADPVYAQQVKIQADIASQQIDFQIARIILKEKASYDLAFKNLELQAEIIKNGNKNSNQTSKNNTVSQEDMRKDYEENMRKDYEENMRKDYEKNMRKDYEKNPGDYYTNSDGELVKYPNTGIIGDEKPELNENVADEEIMKLYDLQNSLKNTEDEKTHSLKTFKEELNMSVNPLLKQIGERFRTENASEEYVQNYAATYAKILTKKDNLNENEKTTLNTLNRFLTSYSTLKNTAIKQKGTLETIKGTAKIELLSDDQKFKVKDKEFYTFYFDGEGFNNKTIILSGEQAIDFSDEKEITVGGNTIQRFRKSSKNGAKDDNVIINGKEGHLQSIPAISGENEVITNMIDFKGYKNKDSFSKVLKLNGYTETLGYPIIKNYDTNEENNKKAIKEAISKKDNVILKAKQRITGGLSFEAAAKINQITSALNGIQNILEYEIDDVTKAKVNKTFNNSKFNFQNTIQRTLGSTTTSIPLGKGYNQTEISERLNPNKDPKLASFYVYDPETGMLTTKNPTLFSQNQLNIELDVKWLSGQINKNKVPGYSIVEIPIDGIYHSQSSTFIGKIIAIPRSKNSVNPKSDYTYKLSTLEENMQYKVNDKEFSYAEIMKIINNESF